MSNYGTLLLNRVIEQNDVGALDRFHIAESHFTSETDRNTYKFIRDYAAKNRGQVPSYAAVTEEVPGFINLHGIEDSYEYLAKKLFNDSAAVEFINVINALDSDFADGQRNMSEYIDDLTDKLTSIKIRTDVRDKVGTDLKNDTSKYLSEYERRKSGESFRTWRSKFSVIGSYVSGNMYVVYGKSGRGKSVITLEDALYMAQQGANVLIWAMEMPVFEVLTRAYVSLSGEQGITHIQDAGIDMNAGFDANAVRGGKLSEDFEESFREFLANLNATLNGNIIVRGVDDSDFNSRTLRALEADIITTNADVVVIDPFYYMDYEKNTSKTAGGDAAETSKKLRALCGRRQVVVIAITQAEETKATEDDDGFREIELPAREDVKKTKQLLEDAATLIAVDTDYRQKRGLVGINKGRDGGEGTFDEILYMPQFGVVGPLSDYTDVRDFDF